MKTSILLTLLSLIVFNANRLFAADRVVQHNGPAGTYASITAAVTAAADGDIIIVNNRQDALPWVEDLTINKSLTFVSAVDNIQWWMEGNISIATAEGRNVTIVGMKNPSSWGQITKTGANPVSRTLLNITYSEIGGDITMISGVNLYLGSSKARNVSFSYGKIIGNDLYSLSCSPDAVATEDVNLIIGNRIGYNIGTPTNAFTTTSTSQYLFFSNNLAKANEYGILISALKSGTVPNRIVNSVAITISWLNSALYIGQASGQLLVDNSMLCGNYGNSYNSGSGVKSSGSVATSLTTFTYNIYYNPSGSLAGTISLNSAQGNLASSAVNSTLINSSGLPTSGTVQVNAGSPMNEYLDLDLTRNDVGVYGGSYSHTNFLPFMSNTESSRVNYMNTPRVVNQGGTVNVQVIGYDK